MLIPGPQSACGTDWKYHLVIKGYNCPEQSTRDAVALFLGKLFNAGSRCPLVYGYHSAAEQGSGNDARVIRISFARAPGIAMSLSSALKQFCQRFFEQKDDRTAFQLSDFGMLGYSPEEAQFKLCWYEVMFTWMQGYRKTDLGNLENKINSLRLKSQSDLRTWMPDWQGVALLTISTGATLLLKSTPSSGVQSLHEIQEASEARRRMEGLVGAADHILRGIGRVNGKESNGTVDAKANCLELIQKIETAVPLMQDPPANRVPIDIHLEVLQKMVDLFETSFRTVTSCETAVECLIKLRTSHINTGLAAGIGAFMGTANALSSARGVSNITNLPTPDIPVNDNFWDKFKHFVGAIERTPGQLAAEAEKQRIQAERSGAISRLKIDGVISGLLALHAVISLGSSAYSAYSTHQEVKKWSAVANLVDGGMRWAQMCELRIHWTYNTGDPSTLSSGQLELLEERTRFMFNRLPTPNELTPDGIRATLHQYGRHLDEKKQELQRYL